ncbi:TrmB family transcriptional regulator [Enterovirga rhinocerotis]|uniref:Sugar-specific transcriptional regulator TrmB n=1 Tax=Enterovirga rhinocerotis TaxID=1339210 RepID=A0A4R7C5P7_9HYPH|nr:helix-turn-helix domain-containing protein [Enterovirga rhinocerotis]TDR93531.1 sugar-specific transcriptional regulator TrmB [Enterovirga rhinocerotis]
MKLEEQLARIGIVGTCYKVYTAAMGLKEAPVAQVAAEAGVARTSAYDALVKLEQDGLVAFAQRAGRRVVIAHEPNVLLERADARRQLLNDLVPTLRSIYNAGSGRPHVQLHEGREGIRKALWDTLSGEAPLLRATFAMSELLDAPGLPEIDEYFAERQRRGIWMRVIRSPERDVLPIWPTSEADLRELRFAPESVLLAMTTFVYGSRVCLISSVRESYGLIIESREFAAFQTALFDALWGISVPVPPAPSD